MSSAVQFSCLAPRSLRSPSASYLLGGVLPMADFRPGGQGRFGAFLRPQCRSRGASDPVPFRRPPDPHRGLCSGQPHSILGHDSLSGPVSPQSHSYHTRFPRKSQRSAPCKTALYCRTAKNRRSGAESPCFAGKKYVQSRPVGQGEKTAGCSPGKPVRIRQRSKGRALSWKFCTRSTRRWRLWRT